MYSMIKKLENKRLASYLLVNAQLLVFLMPGGAIETRDFSEIASLSLVTFNALLMALAICSLLCIPLALSNYRAAAKTSKVLALSYTVVYLLDILSIFPQSPIAMSLCLIILKIIGVACAFLLFAQGTRFEKKVAAFTNIGQENTLKKLSPLGTLILVLVGNAVVVFSTYTALHVTNESY